MKKLLEAQWIKILIFVLLIALAVLDVNLNGGKAPTELTLNTSLKLQELFQTVAALLAWLFVVTLFVERAVEVIVMVTRDQQADLLEQTAADASNNLAAAPSPTDALRSAVSEARKAIITYRAKTKEIALTISFMMGILVSFAGIRALSGVLAPLSKDDGSVTIFKILDIVITGAMIAGGSEGIHRMANAFTSTMDSLSARADKVQKDLQT